MPCARGARTPFARASRFPGSRHMLVAETMPLSRQAVLARGVSLGGLRRDRWREAPRAAPPVAAARRGRRYSCPRWFGPPRPRRPSAAPRSHREGGGDARLGGPGGSGRFGYLGREAKRAAGRDMAAQAQKGERRPHRALTMPHRRTVRMRATRRRGGTFDQLPKMALVNPASKSFAMSRTSPQPPPLHHA